MSWSKLEPDHVLDIGVRQLTELELLRVVSTFTHRLSLPFFSGSPTIDLFTNRHTLVHNGRFPTFKVVHCDQNIVNSIKIK